MFDYLKLILRAWAEVMQRREIALFRHESLQLKEQIEHETGYPVELISEERARLNEMAKGMNPTTLQEIAALDPKGFMPAKIEHDLLGKE